MPPARRIAVMFDADQLTLRERDTLRGIARFAGPAGWDLILDPFAIHHPPGHCDGLIVPARKGVGEPAKRSRVPVVCVTWSHRPFGLIRAVENRYEAGRLAARHFVERGYRTFAYVGFARQAQSFHERHEFTRTLRRLGRRMEAARTFATYASMRRWWNKVMRVLGEWLDHFEPPLGIFVARPGFARALADLALARGLRIPQDVGIIAADNDPVVCELPPALTSIHFDYAEVGTRAAELLDRLMDGGRPPERAVLIPPTLVPRHSTDRQGVADPLVAKALYWIDDRRTEPISAPAVAAALGVGERELQRRFRRAGRDTVLHEIAKARVEHAKLGLADRGETLTGERRPPARLAAIAHECGFGSTQALARAFLRFEGMPPSEWRKQAMLRRQGAGNAQRAPSRHKGPRGTRRKHDPFGA